MYFAMGIKSDLSALKLLVISYLVLVIGDIESEKGF